MVKVKRTLVIGDKKIPLKNKSLLSLLKNNVREAARVEVLTFAYEVRDDIIDRLLAYKSPLGQNQIKRPLTSNQDNEEIPEPEEQRGFEPDRRKNIPKNHKDFLPKRISREPINTKIPFKYHQPLNVEYLKQKIREEKDPRIIISTGDYIRGIVVRRLEKNIERGVDSFRVTQAKRKHKQSDLWLSKLAQLHEFGSRSYTIRLFGNPNIKVRITIPRRPHWRPAMRDARERKQEIRKRIISRLFKLVEEDLSRGK